MPALAVHRVSASAKQQGGAAYNPVPDRSKALNAKGGCTNHGKTASSTSEGFYARRGLRLFIEHLTST